MSALEECHSRLANLLGFGAEPIEVLKCAEEHRAYWRPERVRVLLLAESHVYTTAMELEHKIILPNYMENDIPRGFVRLVYCLGYGENDLLNQPVILPRNSGTPQFWKIFYSCVNPIQNKEDFSPILGRTPLPERIWNKLTLLRRLKEVGVWLVDASLAALYLPGRSKPASSLIETCLRISWDTFIGQVIKDANPIRIICIGKGVARYLNDRLFSLGIPVSVVSQPNARLASTEHLEIFQHYYSVVQQTLEE